MDDKLKIHLPDSEGDLVDECKRKPSLKDKVNDLSNNILENMKNGRQHSDAKKIAKEIMNEEMTHIGALDLIYGKYEKPFADIVARYAIKEIIDHDIEYGQFRFLHDLLSHKCLNEQEKHRIEKGIDKAALNYIKKYNGSFFNVKMVGVKESPYDFEQLVKIMYTEYISEETKKKAENVVLKRIKNKNEFGKNLLFVKNNDNLTEDMKQIAGKSLEEHTKTGLGKYQKR